MPLANFRLSPKPLALAITLILVSPTMAYAETTATSSSAIAISILSQPLGTALNELSAETGTAIGFSPALVAGKTAPAISGNLTARQAVELLLSGTGLIAIENGHGIVIQTATPLRNDHQTMNVEDDVKLRTITVTGLDGQAPPAYAGGQVASGGRIGLLGNQDVFDTPFSMTSYTAELIQNQQARTVADVIMNDASTRLAGSSQGAGETFSIRGFNTGGSGAELYDGLQRMSHRRYSTVEKIERVEVFKGANALLTGTVGAVGGTINLVPKKPLEEAITRFDVTYDSVSRIGVLGDVSRRFGPNEQFGVRVNGIYRDGEGAFENNSEELKDISLALDARTERLRTVAIIDYTKQDLDVGNQLFSAIDTPSAPNLSKAIQQPWERVESRFLRGLLKAEYDLTDNWMMYAAYGATDFKGYWLRTIGQRLNAVGDYMMNAQQSSDVQKTHSGLAGIRGQFETGNISHKISAEYMQAKAESGRLNGSLSSASVASNIYHPIFVPRPVLGHFDRDPRMTSENIISSTAIADTLGFMNDRVLLTIGLRHQSVESKNFDAITGAISGAPYDKSAITPAIALLVKATDALSLYGNYIESLESGPTAPNGTTNEGEIFAPSKTKQIEFGAKLDYGTVGLTVGLFEMARPSGIIDDNNRFGLNGEQRNRGLEVSAFGQPHPQLRVLGGATYIDSELTKTQRGLYDGKSGVGVPELTGVLGFEWDSRSVQNLTFTGRANYTAKQYINEMNSQSIPSYTLYSAGARYTMNVSGKNVTVRATVDNLFDKDYWTTFVGNSGLLYVGSPRRAFLSVSMDL